MAGREFPAAGIDSFALPVRNGCDVDVYSCGGAARNASNFLCPIARRPAISGGDSGHRRITGDCPAVSPTDTSARRRTARKPPPLTPMTMFFVALAVVSTGALWIRDGNAELLDALVHGAGLLLLITPVIVAALVLGGYVQALLPHERVARWLGPGSGARGYLVAITGGILTPAGPFAAFPILFALRQAGAGFAISVVYITAWATLGLQRVLIWELPFLGPEFVGLRLLASLPLPILAGLLAGFVAHRVTR